jgi:hypothetical protein
VTAHDDAAIVAWCSAHADVAAPGWGIPAAGAAGPTLLHGTSAAAVLVAALPG